MSNTKIKIDKMPIENKALSEKELRLANKIRKRLWPISKRAKFNDLRGTRRYELIWVPSGDSGTVSRMPVYSIMDVARVTDIPYQTLYRRISNGLIPWPVFRVVGRNWKYGYHRDEIYFLIKAMGDYQYDHKIYSNGKKSFAKLVADRFNLIRHNYGVLKHVKDK